MSCWKNLVCAAVHDWPYEREQLPQAARRPSCSQMYIHSSADASYVCACSALGLATSRWKSTPRSPSERA
eukprot:3446681-Prymnesium_polylepis.1